MGYRLQVNISLIIIISLIITQTIWFVANRNHYSELQTRGTSVELEYYYDYPKYLIGINATQFFLIFTIHGEVYNPYPYPLSLKNYANCTDRDLLVLVQGFSFDKFDGAQYNGRGCTEGRSGYTSIYYKPGITKFLGGTGIELTIKGNVTFDSIYGNLTFVITNRYDHLKVYPMTIHFAAGKIATYESSAVDSTWGRSPDYLGFYAIYLLWLIPLSVVTLQLGRYILSKIREGKNELTSQ